MSHIPLPEHLKIAGAEDILRFVISRAGLYCSNIITIKEVAEKCDLRPDVVSRFIREGHFTPAAAMKVESGLGRDYIKWEWLVNPVQCVRNGSMF